MDRSQFIILQCLYWDYLPVETVVTLKGVLLTLVEIFLVIDATFFNFSMSTFLHVLVKEMIAKAFY